MKLFKLEMKQMKYMYIKYNTMLTSNLTLLSRCKPGVDMATDIEIGSIDNTISVLFKPKCI